MSLWGLGRTGLGRSPGVTNTAAFKRWFGNSVVVTPDGSPRVVYHASIHTGIEVFKESSDGELGPGVYFTGSVDYLESYKKYLAPEDPESVDVYSVFLRIQNPLVLHGESAQQRYKVQTKGKSKNLKKVLMSLGFDGILRFDYAGKELEQVVVFDPRQIKSATGNQGTFDPTDPNILHGLRRSRGLW